MSLNFRDVLVFFFFVVLLKKIVHKKSQYWPTNDSTGFPEGDEQLVLRVVCELEGLLVLPLRGELEAQHAHGGVFSHRLPYLRSQGS